MRSPSSAITASFFLGRYLANFLGRTTSKCKIPPNLFFPNLLMYSLIANSLISPFSYASARLTFSYSVWYWEGFSLYCRRARASRSRLPPNLVITIIPVVGILICFWLCVILLLKTQKSISIFWNIHQKRTKQKKGKTPNFFVLFIYLFCDDRDFGVLVPLVVGDELLELLVLRLEFLVGLAPKFNP